MKNLVSIIIPCYNAKAYIKTCLESIFSQTYINLEIIIINDGSTDNSIEICEQLQKQDKRIKIINQENKGASIARLEGIKQAKGKYLAFVDSDDIIEPDYIELLLTAIEKHQTLIAACNMVKHYENESPSITKNENTQILDEEELHKRFFNYDFWGFPGKLYHKNVFKGIYFPKATINEDYVVMVQLFDKYKQIAYIDFPLYHYLIRHNDSLSNTRLSIKMMDEWINKYWCYKFYQKNESKWLIYAEAQVAETCCKLINAIGNNNEYHAFKREMQTFLKQHFFSILFNPHLIKGIKFIMGYRMIQ